jgi:pseudouridine-5'-phosphate glycosidase
MIEHALATALSEVESQGVRGRDVTPRILSHVQRLTGGAATGANIALLEHNAHVAGQLAAALSVV